MGGGATQRCSKLIASQVVTLPEKGADKIAYRIDHLRAYQGNRLAKRYQKFLDKFENERLRMRLPGLSQIADLQG